MREEADFADATQQPQNHSSASNESTSCEVGGVVQGDEGPVCGVAQVIGCHGVTVGHQEEGQEEEVEKQGKVESEGEEQLKEHCTWMECGWSEKTSASGLEPSGM